MHRKMGGFLPLSCDGISPRLALSGELVMQTNEHTKPCPIKQSMMLTFTQLELFHVSAATMARGPSGEATKEFSEQRLHQLLLCNSFVPCREEKEKN